MIKVCFPESQTMRGFTLVELLLVIALIGVLSCAASWSGRHLVRDWQLMRAGHQLLEDLKAVQGQAEMSGRLIMRDGVLVLQHRFLAFDEEQQGYTAYLWQDSNRDGVATAGESEVLWQKSLPRGVTFGWSPGIDRRACSNAASAPGNAVSFSSPGYAPCNDRPCIKFDQHGFSAMGPGSIYLSDGEKSLAISGTRPGHFTMCEWDGDRWR